jgi:IstB-like ATP binding protein
MTAAQLERLQEHLQRLRLFKSRERLEALLQDATAKELSYADFLAQVLTEEVASKTAKHVSMRTQLARFPFVKGLESFDFAYQPSLDRKQMQTLSTCHFIEHGENLVILGPPGVGKTHLAVGLGLKAIEHGYRVCCSPRPPLSSPRSPAPWPKAASTTSSSSTRCPDRFAQERAQLVPTASQPSFRLEARLARIVAEDYLVSVDTNRARPHDFDQQSKLRQLGGGLRRPHHRHRNPGSHPPPRHHPQHPGQFLPAQGQAQGRPRPPHRGHGVNPGWGIFTYHKWGLLSCR